MSDSLFRREFLTGSLASLTAGRLLANASASPARQPIYRTLGKTGLRMPVVSMGVMNCDLPSVVRRAYEVGVRHLDTAWIYRNGRNEEMVGGVIKELGVRDKVIISTKLLPPERRRDLTTAAATKQRLLSDFDTSLRRLQMDHVDILYFHAAMNAEDIRNEGVLEGLTQIKKQGKARFIGYSPHEKMTEAIEEANRMGVYEVLLVTINYTMRNDLPFINAIKAAAKKGVGVIAMKTQAGGRTRPEDQKRLPPCSQTALLKWVLRDETYTTAVPGCSALEHMDQDWSVVYDLEYTKEEREFLSVMERHTSVEFCRQCSQCVPDCPHSADIPALMRSHMYAVRYGNEAHARQTLAGIASGRGLDACRLCGDHCTATCRNAVHIARNIAQLQAFA